MVALRVLVVDDNDDVANSISILLRQWGHEPKAARDGLGALAVAAEFRPDVALLDLAMPHMDGYEVGRRLREVAGLEGLTLLALTGYGDAEYQRRSEQAGFAAHLVKPAYLPELASVLHALAGEKAKRPGPDNPPGD
jgi:two-component system CheB/CheR fusion protein